MGRGSFFTEIQGNPRWIIDPLDGTTNFSHQFPHFCVSISLVSENLPLIGVIADPIRNELFFSESRNGAFLCNLNDESNSRKLEVSSNIEISDCLISAGFPYQRDTALFKNILNEKRIRLGSMDINFHSSDQAQLVGMKGRLPLSKMDAKAIVYAVQKELSISAW